MRQGIAHIVVVKRANSISITIRMSTSEHNMNHKTLLVYILLRHTKRAQNIADTTRIQQQPCD